LGAANWETTAKRTQASNPSRQPDADNIQASKSSSKKRTILRLAAAVCALTLDNETRNAIVSKLYYERYCQSK